MKGLDDQLMSFSLKILVSASDGTAFTVSASEIFGGIVFFCSQLWEYFLLGEICIDLLTTKLTGHSRACKNAFNGLRALSKEYALPHFSHQYLYNNMSDSTPRQLIVVGL
jgi:hypothetical protein